ncbi:MAG: replicative DNA helicase [Lachnospiraceae bacterium]|nr:replicative DNA helicase [Lachnospiraceae bacterium]
MPQEGYTAPASAERDTVARIMPHSIEAEQSVLGSMLMNQAAIQTASDILTEADFYSRQNGIIFAAIVELFHKNTPVDPVTLQDCLKEKNLPPELYSAEVLGELIRAVPTSANIKAYASIVAEKALLRRLIRASESIETDCYAQAKELEDILDNAEKQIFDLSKKRGAQDFVPIREVVLSAMARIEEASRTKGSITGVATGFTDLDSRLAGLQKSDLILLAARPSMGKTALALNIAEYAALRNNAHVAIFSLEMSKEQLMNRFFSMVSHVDAQKIRTGELNEQEWIDLMEGAGIIGESNLMIDDTPAITVPEIRSKCRKFKMDYGLDLIMIDYLQLMSGSTRAGDSRQQEISDISRSLKGLARELEVPVVALSQLSRAVEARPNHRPMLSDLRESGAIEQDADVVMFIYRDDYYHEDSEKKGIAEIIIAKQRNGPIGTVELQWIPQQTKFGNLAAQRFGG